MNKKHQEVVLKELIVTDEFDQMRLDRYIGKAYKQLSKPAIQKMIRTGRIKVNQKKVKTNARVSSGDKLAIYIADERPKLQPKKNLPAPIVLYEDDLILAVNKPAGLISHPNGEKEDSLTERIIAYLYEDIKQYDGMFVPGIVNRLDVNTSGIVLAPKTPSAAKQLNELMRKNKITKHYIALVHGRLPKRIKATHYAIKDRQNNKMQLYDEPQKETEEMISIFDPLELSDEFTLVDVRLITGKTHQIRSQLAYLGCPVVGDQKYGSTQVNQTVRKTSGLQHQFLHCSEMSLPMWTDGGTIKIVCDLPDDLKHTLKEFKFKFELF